MLPNDIIAKIVMALPLRDQFNFAFICFGKNQVVMDHFLKRQAYIKMADITQVLSRTPNWLGSHENVLSFDYATLLYDLPPCLPQSGFYKYDMWRSFYSQGMCSDYDLKIENTITTDRFIINIILYLTPGANQEHIDVEIEVESWLLSSNSKYIKGDFSYTINKESDAIHLFENKNVVSELYWPPDDCFKITYTNGFVSSADLDLPSIPLIIPKEFLQNLF